MSKVKKAVEASHYIFRRKDGYYHAQVVTPICIKDGEHIAGLNCGRDHVQCHIWPSWISNTLGAVLGLDSKLNIGDCKLVSELFYQ